MNSGISLWIRQGAGAVLALVLLVAVSPERPAVRMPFAGALATGALAGLGLCLAVTRRRPAPPVGMRLSLVAISGVLIGAIAAGEEVVWRRVVLGELLRSGPALAVTGSSLGFALAHRARQGLHLGTGAVFGGVYLATGVLAACIVAHWTYNLLLLWSAAGARVELEASP
jgi:membrane protease YdiL (CAAX protease family)